MGDKIRKSPNIRFVGFTDDWEQRKLEDITYPAGKKNKDNLALRSYSITNEHGFIPQDEKFENGGTMREADKSMYYIVSPNSFAYNPARINIGSIGYQNTSKDVIVSSLYEVFKTTDDVDDRLLWQWFKSSNFQKLIEKFQEGGVRLYFYYDKLCMGSILLPFIQEQRKIAEYFTNMDNLITLHQRKLELLKLTKKSMLQKMFPKDGESIPEIRFAGFNDAWEQRKLGEVVDVRSGRDYKHLSEGCVPVYGTGGYMLSVNEALSYDKDAIGIGRKGTIDKPYVLKAPFWTVDTLFYAIPKDQYNLDFVFNIFQLINWKMKDESTGVPSLSKTAINEVDIFIPKSLEQEKIGAYFHKIDNLITLHQRELDLLKDLKKSMLQQMFI